MHRTTNLSRRLVLKGGAVGGRGGGGGGRRGVGGGDGDLSE
jgi:hypothetical protein